MCHCLVHLWVAKVCPKGGMMLPRPLSVTDNGRRRRRCCQTGLIKTRRAFKKYRHIFLRPKIARGVHFRSQLVFVSKSSCFQMRLKLSTSLKARHFVTISSSVCSRHEGNRSLYHHLCMLRKRMAGEYKGSPALNLAASDDNFAIMYRDVEQDLTSDWAADA